MFEFSDKVALVIGGAGYLCSPICQQLLASGAKVVVTDLDNERALGFAVSLESGNKVVGLKCDVSNEESIKMAVVKTMEAFGRLDILINAAYNGSHDCDLESMTAADFDKTNRIQLTGSFLLAREAGRVMSSGANMIFFSSMYGRISPEPAIYHEPMLPNPIDYGVVKAGVEQMVRYLAVHYAPRNIRVNAVVPGAFPHTNVDSFNDAEYQDFVARLSKKAPLDRIGEQHELVGPTIFLASDEASFVTGHCLAVDGGWTIW